MIGLKSALLLACVVFAGAAEAGAEAPGYRLGPQDQIQIRVFDLRTGTGEAHKWTAFDSDFIYNVGTAGTVSVPLLGEVQAADRTVAELATTIGDKLQVRVGLASRPDAAVQIVKYRPFYVDGLVQKPGDYEYRPNLTVLQAISIAGGLLHDASDAMTGLTREALTTRGDLRVLSVDRLALEARQARLDAEIEGRDRIAWSPDVRAHGGDADVMRLTREEQMLFDSRRESLRSQIEVLNATKGVLLKQIGAMDDKNAELTHQLDLSKKELDQVSSLLSRGLVVAPRQLGAEQSTAQYQTSILDLQLERLRAQQDLSKADQDILELTNTRRNDALQEATEVRSKLAETLEKMDTAQALMVQAAIRAPVAVSAEAGGIRSPDYFLTRRVEGKAQTLKVEEGDAVQPGDVVRVAPRPPAVEDGSSPARAQDSPSTAATVN